MAEKEYIERGAYRYVLERYLYSAHVQQRSPISLGMRMAIGACIELLGNAHAADVAEVVHGYWYFTEYEYFSCSVCGGSYYNSCESTAEAKQKLADGEVYPYCPHCGAKMDGEEE